MILELHILLFQSLLPQYQLLVLWQYSPAKWLPGNCPARHGNIQANKPGW